MLTGLALLNPVYTRETVSPWFNLRFNEKFELYNLIDDPNEQNNLIGIHPEIESKLKISNFYVIFNFINIIIVKVVVNENS